MLPIVTRYRVEKYSMMQNSLSSKQTFVKNIKWGGNPMGPNMYLYEKAREAHSRDLQREAEKERLLRQLPQHRRSLSRRAAGKLGVLLLKLGTRLKQFEQSSTMLEDHI